MFDPPIRQGWLTWRKAPGGDPSTTRASRRPRVVLECPDYRAPAHVARSLSDAGFDVTVCNGPNNGQRCSLAETHHCRLVEGADAVVNLLGAGSEQCLELRSLLKERYPLVPLVAGTLTPPLADERSTYQRVEVDPPLDIAELIDRVRANTPLRPNDGGPDQHTSGDPSQSESFSIWQTLVSLRRT